MKEILITEGIYVAIITIICAIWFVKEIRWKFTISSFLIILVWLFVSVLGVAVIDRGFKSWDDYAGPPQGTKIFKVDMVVKATDIHGKCIPSESRYAVYYDFPFRPRKYIKFLNFNDLVDKDKTLYYETLKDYLKEYSSQFTEEEAKIVARYMNDPDRIIIEKEDL